MNQFHLVEIPEILIVETRHCLVFMLEVTQPASFAVSCNARLGKAYSVWVEPVPV
jgi:hypothetical protein